MKKFWFMVALWNTVVAMVNMTVLPRFVASEVMVFTTPTSQLLPIAIPFIFYLLCYEPVRRLAKKAFAI